MSEPIPVVADIPSKDPRLGFEEYAEAIADAIRGGQPPQFTIGLYGAWGSGKSSLLNALDRNLSKRSSGVIPVMFDAWRYEKSSHIILPLLHAVYNKVKEVGGMKQLVEDLERALKSLVSSLKFSFNGIGFDMADLKESWEKQGLIPLDDAFSKPFNNLRMLPDALKGRRIAVLIDDLDRCSAGNVVSVLESINLVMDIPGFIFVLALDYDVLVKAVAEKYPYASGDVFIQKMIQVPFRVPPLSFESERFLSELIPELNKKSSNFPVGFDRYLLDISTLGLQKNPRQIKRLFNSFLLLQRILRERGGASDQDLLTLSALIGFQLQWPSHYHDFQNAVLGDDEDPYKSVVGDEDESDIIKYCERFLKDKVNLIKLKELLQLASVVAIEESTSSSLSLTEIRERNLRQFLTELENKGFIVNPRSDRLYQHPTKPETRFAIEKTVIRQESLTKQKRRSGRRWKLIRSFSIVREVPRALDAADKVLSP